MEFLGKSKLQYLEYGQQKGHIEATEAIHGWNEQQLPYAHQLYKEDILFPKLRDSNP